MLPPDNEPDMLADDILCCGTGRAEYLLSATMNNIYTLDYLINGQDRARVYFFSWLEQCGDQKSASV